MEISTHVYYSTTARRGMSERGGVCGDGDGRLVG